MNIGTLADGDDWLGYDLPSFSDFSTPSTPSAFTIPGASGSGSNIFSNMDFSWLGDVAKGAVNIYGQKEIADTKNDALKTQLQLQQQAQYPYGYPYGATQYPGAYPNMPYLPPVPFGAGMSMTTIIGLAGLALAVFTLMKKD